MEPPFGQNGQNGQNGQDGRAEWIEGSDPWSPLLAAHAELFPGDAGAGAFRRELVGVGPRGSSIESAYIPPHPDDVPALMKDLASTDRSGTDPLGPLDPLICAALIHYQFETIHPFRDGNGRLGRALILRELLASGVRAAALIAPSVPILARRGDYCAALTAVRERGDFEGWVRLFLGILGRSADEAARILRGTRAVRREAEAAVMAVGAGESGRVRETGVGFFRSRAPEARLSRLPGGAPRDRDRLGGEGFESELSDGDGSGGGVRQGRGAP